MDNTLLFFTLFLVSLTCWTTFLTYLVFSQKKKTKNFFSSGNYNLREMLEKISADNRKFHQRAVKIESDIKESASYIKESYQKLGIVRYNPFKDTGGDMSFSVAILDMDDSGVVITNIHGREADRVYAKQITKGKSLHNLSAEEIEAIDKAIKKGEQTNV